MTSTPHIHQEIYNRDQNQQEQGMSYNKQMKVYSTNHDHEIGYPSAEE